VEEVPEDAAYEKLEANEANQEHISTESEEDQGDMGQ